MRTKLRTIAIIVSGGDAPGINAAIRAVVRTAFQNNLKVIAVDGGYDGAIEGNFTSMDVHSVSGIIHRGGTIIKTTRSEKFKSKKWRKVAYRQLQRANIDGVILIGGNGSFAGANVFTSEFDMPFIGIPKTIDNDVYGTDFSIGFDTATNTALDAIDRIRDTADSHHRLFFLEVMGRDLGFIALHCGIGAGAEAILVPEIKTNVDDLIAKLEMGWKRNKSSLIVVIAEGAVKGGVIKVAEKVKARFGHYDIRISTLGHIQRGGNPSCSDRVLASRLGYQAVKAYIYGEKNVIVGIKNNKLIYTPFAKSFSGKQVINKDLLLMADELST